MELETVCLALAKNQLTSQHLYILEHYTQIRAESNGNVIGFVGIRP